MPFGSNFFMGYVCEVGNWKLLQWNGACCSSFVSEFQIDCSQYLNPVSPISRLALLFPLRLEDTWCLHSDRRLEESSTKQSYHWHNSVPNYLTAIKNRTFLFEGGGGVKNFEDALWDLASLNNLYVSDAQPFSYLRSKFEWLLISSDFFWNSCSLVSIRYDELTNCCCITHEWSFLIHLSTRI